MAKRLSVEEARGRVIDTINVLKNAESADLDKCMCKYAVYRDLQENSPEEYEAEYVQISNALFGHPEDVPQVTEVTEITEIPQLPAVLDPVLPAVPRDTPEASRTSGVLITGARMAARAAAVLANALLMACNISLPVVARGAYQLAIIAIYTALDMADAARVWIPYWAGRVIRDIRPLLPSLIKGNRRAGKGLVAVTMECSRHVAGIAVVAFLVAVKAVSALAHGAVAVAGGCRAGWSLRSEIIKEQKAV